MPSPRVLLAAPGGAPTPQHQPSAAALRVAAPNRTLVKAARASAPTGPTTRQPAIILVEPIMGENIGAAARAMKNFGLTDLRLVAPKDGWPNALAERVASNAQDVLQAAQVYDTVDEAVADLTYLYAATARPRFMNKDYVLSRHLYQDLTASDRVGIMFGQEKNGLKNADVARANKVVTIDANPVYPVLNLAQSVALLAYELYNGSCEEAARKLQGDVAGEVQALASQHASDPSCLPSSSLRPDLANDQQLCTKAELESFLSALERELEAAHFFESDAKKKASVSVHLRNIFTRIPKLSKAEVSMLRGALSKLTLAQTESGTWR